MPARSAGNVSQLGIRRERTSAPVATAATRTAGTATRSGTLSVTTDESFREDPVLRVIEGRLGFLERVLDARLDAQRIGDDHGEGDGGDERREQAVLDQVFATLVTNEVADQLLHVVLLLLRSATLWRGVGGGFARRV